MKIWKRIMLTIIILVNPTTTLCQEPIDLFSDSVKLANGYLRLATWNLEHINLHSGARDLLPGDTIADDFTSLVNTFAKAIDDLDLDLVVAVEVQPRQNEPDRLVQIRERLNQLHTGTGTAENNPWRSMQTDIPYDNPNNPFSNLQFGLLWNSTEVEVNENGAILLEELRQPRDENGTLLHRRLRIPWLVPFQSGELESDLLIVHLKSGGQYPQALEVEAISGFIRLRFSGTSPRHLILLGDWNIRPDRGQGRGRLRQLQVTTETGNLMRILTIEEIKPALQGWESFGTFSATNAIADLVPFTHFNNNPQYHTIDTMLDHIAIARSMNEIFDHPILVELASDGTDLRAGIEIARPMIREEDYLKITDHVPLILTLRTSGVAGPEPPTGESLVRIIAAIPNPHGVDRQLEQVSIRNFGTEAVSLIGWKIGDSTPNYFWEIDPNQYDDPEHIGPGETVNIIRRGRGMALNNSGDTIRLINNQEHVVDFKTYGSAASGQIFYFE